MTTPARRKRRIPLAVILASAGVVVAVYGQMCAIRAHNLEHGVALIPRFSLFGCDAVRDSLRLQIARADSLERVIALKSHK